MQTTQEKEQGTMSASDALGSFKWKKDDSGVTVVTVFRLLHFSDDGDPFHYFYHCASATSELSSHVIQTDETFSKVSSIIGKLCKM